MAFVSLLWSSSLHLYGISASEDGIVEDDGHCSPLVSRHAPAAFRTGKPARAACIASMAERFHAVPQSPMLFQRTIRTPDAKDSLSSAGITPHGPSGRWRNIGGIPQRYDNELPSGLSDTIPVPFEIPGDPASAQSSRCGGGGCFDFQDSPWLRGGIIARKKMSADARANVRHAPSKSRPLALVYRKESCLRRIFGASCRSPVTCGTFR